MKIPTIILTNRVFIPIKCIDEDTIKKNYDKWIYDQKSCQRCEYRHERHSEFCDPCDAFKGHFVQYKKVVSKGKSYWSLPRAEIYRLKEFGIKKYKLKNNMSRGTKLDSRIEITKKPYDYQKKSIKELVVGDGRDNYFPHGILKAAPRSGKCVVGSTLITTEFGLHPIQDLFLPDHQDGEVREAHIRINSKEDSEFISHLYKKTVNQTIKITTKSGFEICGTPEHPVFTKDGWKRLDKLSVDDFVCLKLGTSVGATKAPAIHHTLENFPTKLTVDIAKILGYVFGVGKELQSFLASTNTEVAKILSALGVSENPKLQLLPKIILSAPIRLQKEFISALKATSDSSQYYFENSDFAKSIQILLLNHGIFSTLENGQHTYRLDVDFEKIQDGFLYEKISNIKILHDPTTVYDVTVPGSHSFVGNGLVVHNTLMSLVAAIRLKRKTLILANQEDLLKQFIIELKDSTNIEDLDKFDGKVSFGMCSKVADFEKYDICLATYQTFISKIGKEKLKKVRKLFGTVFVDEAHGCAASAFSKVIDSFCAENRFGLTATEKRKDKLDFITEQILGPVITEASVESLIPRVVIIPTGIAPKYNYRTWNAAMQFLANNADRNKLILQWLKKDLKDGRKIVIPVTYKKQVQELVESVRKMGYTAEAFVGGMNREALLARARAGEIDVVVGIRSIIAKGINVKIWSAIYTIAPISNPPNYYQETTRICTPLVGKPEPIIRLFVDQMPMTKGCFRTCWTQTILPMKYRFSEKTKEKAKAILSTMRGGYKEDMDFDGTDTDGKVYRDTALFDIGGKSAGATKTKAMKKTNTIQTIGLFKR